MHPLIFKLPTAAPLKFFTMGQKNLKKSRSKQNPEKILPILQNKFHEIFFFETNTFHALMNIKIPWKWFISFDEFFCLNFFKGRVTPSPRSSLFSVLFSSLKNGVRKTRPFLEGKIRKTQKKFFKNFYCPKSSEISYWSIIYL